ncbi:G patch domain-containing protein 4 isoform X1 [Achroia grisella]|uniref:G patch domain-containing protein 4 isoform X1 n=1 Tax=Achroia grisella TaxID=688607 RepID=UPI0027D2DC74|nr:G patch domain-containing protein 4 isoform X1 [Achroia grisella]
MDFARKMLEKYGWTDGKGLGKHENGISEALKPKLKRSVTGVGHDAASEFNEHWWSQLYDKAAGNVQVEEVNGKTKRITAKDGNEFEITNSTWRLNKKKKVDNDGEYSEYFVRKAVLTSGGSKVVNVQESDSDEEVEKKDVFKLTDEELFAACGGRTAHKGARHGLKAVGKLARIAQQEQALLKEPQFVGYSHRKRMEENLSPLELSVVENTNLDSDADVSVVRKKKKKKKHCNSESNLEKKSLKDISERPHSNLTNDVEEKNTEEILNSVDKYVNGSISKKSKRKKEKINTENSELCENINVIAKSKKLKKNSDIEEIVAMDTECDIKEQQMDTLENCMKKKKKKKQKTIISS